MEYVDSDLATATLLDTTGEAVPLSHLYAERPTLVVFVRHFGCIFAESAWQIVGRNADDGRRGIGLSPSNGTPLMAEAFAQTLKVDIPIYTDPSREIFKKAGMKRNFGLGFATIKQGLRSWKAGHRQGAVAGDPGSRAGAYSSVAKVRFSQQSGTSVRATSSTFRPPSGWRWTLWMQLRHGYLAYRSGQEYRLFIRPNGFQAARQDLSH